MKEVIKNCIPIVVGALIVIIPNMIEKIYDFRKNRAEKQHKEKQDIYVEMVSLFSKVLKEHNNKDELEKLIKIVNLISITGDIEVVKALNLYIDSWGKADTNDQTQKYNNLLKAIRIDLGIDKKRNKDFPEIGLRDINVIVNTQEKEIAKG